MAENIFYISWKELKTKSYFDVNHNNY